MNIVTIIGVLFLSVINCDLQISTNFTNGRNGILESMIKDIKRLKGQVITLNEKLRQEESLSKDSLKKNHDQKWYLGMNLNPDDGHIMGYATGWDDGMDIGKKETALTKDYLDSKVWKMPVNRIAIVRHQKGVFEAVKVWTFKKKMISMLDRFKAMTPGREIATEGGPQQVFIPIKMMNIKDDPIFSVPGDIAINWWYGKDNYMNGCRIALTGGHLSAANVNDDNTHGLGNDFALNRKNILNGSQGSPTHSHEISNIQDCPINSCSEKNVKIQGKDHGTSQTSGPVYGNYAIYVSVEGERFPVYENILSRQMGGR